MKYPDSNQLLKGLALALIAGAIAACDVKKDDDMPVAPSADSVAEPYTPPVQDAAPVPDTSQENVQPEAADTSTMTNTENVESAIAEIQPLSGSSVEGTVTFTAGEDEKVTVAIDLQGLQPKGVHGFHVHETGDCSSEDGASAGGHFNPDGQPHGSPDDETQHRGDMGNITADENGDVQTEMEFDYLTLQGEASILGKAVLIHADEDDLTSQPSGNAGARIGCGVIQQNQDAAVE